MGGHCHCLPPEKIRYPFGTCTLTSKRHACIDTGGRWRNNQKQWWFEARPFRDYVGGAQIEHKTLYGQNFLKRISVFFFFCLLLVFVLLLSAGLA